MLAAVQAALPADVFIGAAAVADWRVETQGSQKLKKTTEGPPALQLVENPDILAAVATGRSEGRKLVVGFAAETSKSSIRPRKAQGKELRHDCRQRRRSERQGVRRRENEVHIITRDNVIAWPQMSKDEVASV